MTGDAKRLQAAFLQKEQNQNFLSNLARLKSEGSVTEEQQEAMKTGYQQSMIAAVSEIANIKNQLKLQLQATQEHISTLRMELESLNLKHKVGEISLEKHQHSQQKLMKTINQNEKTVNDIQKLMAAKSSAQVGIVSPKVGFSLPNSRMVVPNFASEDLREPLAIASFCIAGIMLIAVLILPILDIWGETKGFIQGNVFVGLVCLLASLGYAGTVFIKGKKMKGATQVGIGGIATLMLIVFIYMFLARYGAVNGTEFMVSHLFQFMGAGFWVYALASLCGIVVGVINIRD